MNEDYQRLKQLAELTASVERAVAELKDAASDFSDEVAPRDESRRARAEPFSGSAAQNLLTR